MPVKAVNHGDGRLRPVAPESYTEASCDLADEDDGLFEKRSVRFDGQFFVCDRCGYREWLEDVMSDEL